MFATAALSALLMTYGAAALLAPVSLASRDPLLTPDGSARNVTAYAGLVASYALSLPSGPSIVLAAGVVYFVSLVFGRAGGALRRLPKRRHLEA